MVEKIDIWTTKKSFNSYEDHETFPKAEIKCPNCGDTVGISMKDLKRHENSTFTNLIEKDNKDLTYITVDNSPELPNSYLDYYCPNCKRPIRILYDSFAGGKHGEFGFELKYIVTI